jgi:hypothetical protein
VVTPNIVIPTSGPVGPILRAVGDHPRHRMCGVRQDHARDRIESRDVHDRRHEHDVRASDVRRGIAAGHGRHQHFRHAQRQRAECRREQRRPAAPAEADHPRQLAGRVPAAEKLGQRLAHRRQRTPAIANPQHRRAPARVAIRDHLARDARRNQRRRRGAYVHHQRPSAGAPYFFGNERQFAALRVHRGNGIDALHV